MCQLIYFIIAPLADILTLVKGREDNWLVKLRDTVFASLAFPLGVFVAASFWGIYMMDRELIFPPALDKIIPPWLNHLLHTWCAVLAIVEGAFIRHKYPKNRVGLGLLAVFTVTYLTWITWIAYVAEFWVYPFLRIMPNSARAAFFVVCGCVIAFFYFLGKWMTLFIWGGEEEKNAPTMKPKDGTKKKVKKAE
ncbi:Androgen-induced protein 1 protein [Desmophyllum pertusum]|uniref:Androgen-induced protein 1 protein n=1 Tax=Desmophyllum pertusum TaxID=174260 RepID=A0A9W9YSW2_9CNID|nr:Androgen-induced protein 1 protein [Desmophyllum pertusum]